MKSSESETSDSDSNDNHCNINNIVCVDLLGFKAGLGKFICKEFCLVSAEKICFHTFVKSSINFKKLSGYHKRHVEFDTKYRHGIPFDEKKSLSTITVSELITEVLPKLSNKIILVHSEQKADWFKYIFRHHSKAIHAVMTLNEINNDEFPKKTPTFRICEYHNKIYGWGTGPCALSTVLQLRYFAKKNWNK